MRSVLLPTHVVSAVGLIGADLTLVVLGVRGAAGAPADQIYPAMSTIALLVMIPLGAVALTSGLALAVVTGTGLRVGWVATKLTVTLLLAVVLVGFLAPGLAGVASDATGAGGVDSPPAPYAIGPAVSATLLTVNVLLALRRPARLPGPFTRATTRPRTRTTTRPTKGATRAAPR